MVIFRVTADDGLCKFREVVEVLMRVSDGAGGGDRVGNHVAVFRTQSVPELLNPLRNMIH